MFCSIFQSTSSKVCTSECLQQCSWYKSLGVLLKVAVIEHELEALAFLFACGKWYRLAILHSDQDATIQIRLCFCGDYSCDKIVTTGLLYCITQLLYSSLGLVQ